MVFLWFSDGWLNHQPVIVVILRHAQLDVVSYNALLSSAAASAAWDRALELMQRMATEDQVGMQGICGIQDLVTRILYVSSLHIITLELYSYSYIFYDTRPASFSSTNSTGDRGMGAWNCGAMAGLIWETQ